MTTYHIIEICDKYPPPVGVRVVAVGHGSVNRSHDTPASNPRELILKTSPFQTIDSWLKYDICPRSLICTETTVEGSGLCYNDDASPLFIRGCYHQRPICLLGIATPTLKDESPLRDCKGQADFTSIPYFHDWISTRIASYMD